jgi:hypothetical protein
MTDYDRLSGVTLEFNGEFVTILKTFSLYQRPTNDGVLGQ